MRKIPTVFERDWDGDRSRVLDKVTPGCEWVVAGEGRALQKLDGTCCLIRDGRLFKRHEVKLKNVRADRAKRAGQHKERRLGEIPAGFILVEESVLPGYDETPELVGWVPVGDGPEDKWHRDALAHRGEHPDGTGLPSGTYELVGPKINGNPEGFDEHCLVAHDPASTVLAVRVIEDVLEDAAPISHASLAAWFVGRDIEGIVWHHPDGRMAKVKGRDFGVKRTPS